ncbi:DUF4198 domain-containing protein [Hydrogenimonas thermophila]|uniref:DUF4198 domain-containing protein n=1 Tax=Hydrogenimonas thermophila TaxID=223786 RepID=UPI0029370CBC|nr:DUF4198 domain-containing protein [Hydrogenimonas thermophila]WOE69167.1 DUF4198 domain-containing protein [Hydrogenimonas thermophila]WOE71677.1 DUF4198 domain-containing protein [Hydrogenimonas thermophila]
MKIVLAILMPIFLFAHDVWIEKDGQNWTLNYGHLHLTKEHGGKKVMPYDPKSVINVICSNGGKVIKPQVNESYPFVVKGECDELFILMDNGYFTKTPYGTKHLPKDKVKMAIKSWRSFESVKRVEKNSKKPISDNLEIVLLKKPESVGEKARLQLFYHSKPVKDVVVAYDDKVRGTTDEDGKINIRIRHSGLQNIKATLREPCGNGKCDEIVHTTALNFEVKE